MIGKSTQKPTDFLMKPADDSKFSTDKRKSSDSNPADGLKKSLSKTSNRNPFLEGFFKTNQKDGKDLSLIHI